MESSVFTNVFNTICVLVSDFNYLFGVINYSYDPESGTKTFDNLFDNQSTEYNEKQIKLRQSLIIEESKELVEAIQTNNIIEIIDALCDILYVVAGAKVYFNLTNTNINSKLKNTEFNQVVGLDSNRVDKLVQTISENNDFKKDLAEISDQIIKMNMDLEQITNWFVSRTGDKTSEFDEKILVYNNILDNISLKVFEIGNQLNLDIEKLFKIVHDSNMSKVCQDENTAVKTVQWYKTNETRYISPAYKKINLGSKDYWIVYDESTKKILKSIDWIEVKFY